MRGILPAAISFPHPRKPGGLCVGLFFSNLLYDDFLHDALTTSSHSGLFLCIQSASNIGILVRGLLRYFIEGADEVAFLNITGFRCAGALGGMSRRPTPTAITRHQGMARFSSHRPFRSAPRSPVTPSLSTSSYPPALLSSSSSVICCYQPPIYNSNPLKLPLQGLCDGRHAHARGPAEGFGASVCTADGTAVCTTHFIFETGVSASTLCCIDFQRFALRHVGSFKCQAAKQLYGFISSL